MKETKEAVNKILQSYPRARDNDNLLVALTLVELGLYKNISLTNYLLNESDNYPSFESITRCRRLLQSIHPELRGSKYQKRHDYQSDFKGNLKEIRDSELAKGQERYKAQNGNL